MFARRVYIIKFRLSFSSRFSHDLTHIDGGHYLKMPKIMDSTSGLIDEWFVKEGARVRATDNICQVTCEGVTLNLNTGQDCYLAKVLKKAGETVDVDKPIGLYVNTKDDLMSVMDEDRHADYDAAHAADVEELKISKTKGFDQKMLLRQIKYLIDTKKIEDGSDFSKQLLSLARKGNTELLSIFEASFDESKSGSYEAMIDSFDAKFFLDNAKDIVDEGFKK